MVYEIMELLLRPEETTVQVQQQMYDSFFFYWNKYPKLSRIAMLCFLRSYRTQLESQLNEIYKVYGETNFCIRKLSAEDLLAIEHQFLSDFVKRGGNNVI